MMPPQRTVTRSRRRSRTARDFRRENAHRLELIMPAILLVAALLLGGSANAIGNMVIDCLAVLLLATLAIRFDAMEWRRSRLGWLIVAATVAIALYELVPLPYSLWRTLPGRAGPALALDTLGLPAAARPLSLDPDATVSTLVETIPGLAMFVAALAMGERNRRSLGDIVIAGAAVSVVVGSLQVTGQTQFYLYQKSNFGNLTGLFANRNHAADLLLIAIALLAPHLRETPSNRFSPRLLVLAAMATLAMAIVLTASRTGIVLLLVETIAITLFVQNASTRRSWRPLGIALVGCGVLALILATNHGVQNAIGRFNDLSSELRAEIWSGTLTAALGYWPVGSGLGTFVPVYMVVEQLDTMPRQVVNHAHNEYIELFCELGLIGVVAILGYLTGLAVRIASVVRGRTAMEIRPALAGIIVLLVGSMIDFPLRNGALMAVFGLLNGAIFCALRDQEGNDP